MAKIYFRYGAMNCGKTTALIQVAHNYEENGMKVALIKSFLDKKGDDFVVSRIGAKRKVDLWIKPEEKILDKLSLKNIDCILVDEVQFLTSEQVKEFFIIAKIYDVPVIGYGLKTNFTGELFEGSKAMLEVADAIEELFTICKCGKKARFNARVCDGEYTLEGKEIAIDGIDAHYEPLCGKCFIEKVLKIKREEDL